MNAADDVRLLPPDDGTCPSCLGLDAALEAAREAWHRHPERPDSCRESPRDGAGPPICGCGLASEQAVAWICEECRGPDEF